MADKLSVSDSVTKVYQYLYRLKTEQKKTALKTKTKDGGCTPLVFAAHKGVLISVKNLLDRSGADIEARGTLWIGNEFVAGCTPLWAAAASGHLDVVKLLIERNADVEGRTQTGSTPLRAAAYVGHLDIVRCLVESGADVNARTIIENTPLMVACHHGHLSVVTYLIDKGAFMDLQNKDGSTALHEAVLKSQLKVVTELLVLGASQLPNNKGLTPLLFACDKCSIEIVEYLIKRPECTKEQRIDALELLGTTIANDSPGDSEKAFSYMKRGMEERYEDLTHPLLKKKMEPLEAYQNRKESQTLEELALLEGDDHAIAMEGLIIRERILGSDNPLLREPIRYRACVLADSKQYELCICLWQRALEKALNCGVPITEVTDDLEYQIAIFGEMVQKSKLLRPNFIEDVFEILVAASEIQAQQLLKSGKSHQGHENEGEDKTVYYALYLLNIYTKVKVQNDNMIDFLQSFLRLNPRTNDGNTLLHLAVWHETQIFSYHKYMLRSVCKLPSVETIKLILHAGGDVNSVNRQGNTPLHLAVMFKPAELEEVEILREMLLLLLDIGALQKLANINGQTPLESCKSDEARRILSENRGLRAMNVDIGDVREF